MNVPRSGTGVPAPHSSSSSQHQALIAEVTRSLKTVFAKTDRGSLSPEMIASIIEQLDQNPNINSSDVQKLLRG